MQPCSRLGIRLYEPRKAFVISPTNVTPVPSGVPSDDDSRSGVVIRRSWRAGVGYYYLTSLIVVIGVFCGIDIGRVCRRHPDSSQIVPGNIFERFASWDGVWYRQIATDGYSNDPAQMSSVAFFPFYPMVSRAVWKMTGWPIDVAMVAVSHLFLLGGFIAFSIYLRLRNGDRSTDESDLALLALGLFPTTLYFRMSYTESSSLFTMLIALIALRKQWPLFVVAALIGLSTSTRSVCVALVLPFLWHLWQQKSSWTLFCTRAAVLMPVCCWGLLAYMAYQWVIFGDALAFVHTQRHWYEREPPSGVGYIASLALFEPLSDVYDPDCPCYWRRDPPDGIAVLNMQFMAPAFVVLTWFGIAYGALRRLLSVEEVLLSVGLLAIPYLTHAYRACMSSEARYAALAFPFYMVVGHVLARAPKWLVNVICGLCSVLLAFYSALFVTWYWFY